MIAALPTHDPIQYVQAIKNPAKSPKAALVYTIGPPVRGSTVPRLAKLNAISSDPADVIIHASIAVLGFDAAASDATDVKIPEPIQFPTTMATAAARPRSLFNSGLPAMTSLIFLIFFIYNYSILSAVTGLIC
jgi:hypothetical protein